MEFLKEILKEGYEAFARSVSAYNQENPDRAVKLANLSEGGYVSREKYAALQSELERAEKSRKEGDEAREQLKLAQERYDAEAGNLRQELERVRLDSEVEKSLLRSGARSVKALRGLLDLDGVKLENGRLDGLEEQLQQIRQENGFLFEDAPIISTGMSQGGGMAESGGFMDTILENQAKRD